MSGAGKTSLGEEQLSNELNLAFVSEQEFGHEIEIERRGGMPMSITKRILSLIRRPSVYWMDWVVGGDEIRHQIEFYPDGKTLTRDYKNGQEIGKPIQLANWK